ncbi:uncharacterized protein C2845_PM04G07400 [Panicum miliaceum]|uniref:Uncharacterized protein n=1 Tax=Panicum miliaceum TaxID=4540 RepID=A0A3L6QV09_PANMI|nr:uncharacterized protein C2845_PM04G07400 [Panicum miliaceum]
MSSKRVDARLQKEQSTHAARNVEKEGKRPKEKSKWASCWDQKVPRAHESNVRSFVGRSENTDQDSVMRNQMEVKKSTVRNDNHLELSKGLVKGGSLEGSSVRRQMELNIPVEQNVCKETNKASSNQDLFQNPKGSLKHGLDMKSASKKDDVSPPAVPDLQKLIQKAKGARKFSEKPRCDNPNKVDLSET